jgi:hypothetical protein
MDSFWSFSRLYVRAGVEPGTRQASVFGVGISFMVFTSIVMGLRMYVRLRLIRAIGPDDSKHYSLPYIHILHLQSVLQDTDL